MGVLKRAPAWRKAAMLCCCTALVFGGALTPATADAPVTCVEGIPGERCPEWVETFVDSSCGCGFDDVAGIVANDDTVFVTAESMDRPSTGYWHILTAAFDSSTGDLRWGVSYQGEEGVNEVPRAITLSPDGRVVYVVGMTNLGNIPYEPSTQRADAVTIAYDAATGKRLWAHTYRGSAGLRDELHQVVAGEDGSRVYAAGLSSEAGPSSGGYDGLIISYVAATGEVDWIYHHDAPAANSAEAALALAVRGTTLYVGGYAGGSINIPYHYTETSFDVLAILDDRAHGRPNLLWRQTYDAGVADTPTAGAIALTQTRVIVSGWSSVPAADDECANGAGSNWGTRRTVIGLDIATGARAWSETAVAHPGPIYFPGGPPAPPAYVTAVATHPAGDVAYVSGFARGACEDAGTTIAYDAEDGARAWITEAEPVSASPSRDVVVGDAGETVFVALDGWPSANVVAYSADSGVARWRGRHNQSTPGTDWTTIGGLALSPDGSMLYGAATFSHLHSFLLNPRNFGALAYSTE